MNSTNSTNTAALRLADGVLDFSMLALTTWTIAYHICLVGRINAWVAMVVTAIALPGCWWLTRRASAPGELSGKAVPAIEHDSRPRPARDRPGSVALTCITLGTAAAAAALFAWSAAPWWLVWLLWLSAAGMGLGRALRRHSNSAGSSADGSTGSATGVVGRPVSAPLDTVAALCWSVGLAVLSLFVLKPDWDDAHYLNLSAWVAEHGTFPLRDTLFSNLGFPALFWPPMASYDALVGAAGRALPVSHLDIAYLVVPAVGTFLGVVALWRLLRTWRVPYTGIALTVTMVFLIWNGMNQQSYGSFFLARMWQGKVLFLNLMVPLLLIHLQRYTERPSPLRGAFVAAAGVAAVGLTTNAMYLVPLMVVAGVVPLLRRSPGRAAAGLVAGAAYPLGAGLVTLGVGGYTPENYAAQLANTVAPWLTHHVLGDGVQAGIVLFAVLIGSLLVRHANARVIVAAVAVVAAGVYAPGAPRFIFDLTGVGLSLWRVMWILPAAALLGALASHSYQRLRKPSLRVAAPLVLCAALVASGSPVWMDASGNLALTSAPQWKQEPRNVTTAKTLLHRMEPGDVLLAGGGLSITVATMTTRVKTVAARIFYMHPLADIPAFHQPARLRLKKLVTGRLDRPHWERLRSDLRLLSVDVACSNPANTTVIAFFREHGYAAVPDTPGNRCLASGAR